MLINRKNKSNKIARFSVDSIVRAEHMAVVAPERVTRFDYLCIFDLSFCVLADQVSVVGVGLADKSTILRENILDASALVVTYSANRDEALTVAPHEKLDSLFAGSCNRERGQVVQYRLSTGQVIKNFGPVGIGLVVSSIRFGNLIMFGGESHKFAAIDSVKRQVAGQPVTSAVQSVYSMAICETAKGHDEKRILLFVCGLGANYSNDRTDVFDITGLVERENR